MLVIGEAKIEHVDKFGNSVLHFATRDGHVDICEYLIKKYTRLVKMRNQEGKTPLSYAHDNNHSTIAAMIKNHGGEAMYAERNKKVRELAERLMGEFPDHNKSIFKHQ